MKSMTIEGKPVKDAKKGLHVKITPQDVKKGALKNSNSCAAAQALMRQTGCQQAKVHVRRTYVKQHDGQWVRYETPPALRSEIVAFDRGGTFEPGEYKLLPVSPANRAGQRKKRANHTSKQATGKKKGLRKLHVTTGIRQRFSET